MKKLHKAIKFEGVYRRGVNDGDVLKVVLSFSQKFANCFVRARACLGVCYIIIDRNITNDDVVLAVEDSFALNGKLYKFSERWDAQFNGMIPEPQATKN